MLEHVDNDIFTLSILTTQKAFYNHSHIQSEKKIPFALTRIKNIVVIE